MIYATILNFFAASLTGSLFKMQALFLLLGIVITQFACVAISQSGISWGWIAVNFVDLQIGYLCGACARSGLERLGYISQNQSQSRFP
jgi:hypothetical protein